MDFSKPVIFEIGQSRIIVHLDKVTPAKIDQLANKLGEVKQKNSIFGKYPLEDGETLEKWQERVLPLLGEETKKKEDEDVDTYMTRIFKPENDKKQLVLGVLSAIGETFDQPGKVTKEVEDQFPYISTKMKIVSLLKACDLPTMDLESI